jgi:hypothetical protein
MPQLFQQAADSWPASTLDDYFRDIAASITLEHVYLFGARFRPVMRGPHQHCRAAATAINWRYVVALSLWPLLHRHGLPSSRAPLVTNKVAAVTSAVWSTQHSFKA